MELNRETEIVKDKIDKKKNESKIFHPIIIIGIAIVILYLVSFLPSDINVFGLEIKPVDIIMDLRQ